MKSLISIIVLSLILTNCGFKPIYNSKDSNFEVIEIDNKNENKNSFFIEKTIMSLSNKDAEKKVNEKLSDFVDSNPDLEKSMGAKAIQGKGYLPGSDEKA